MRQSREIPSKIIPKDDNAYFEELTKAILRAGSSWGVVRAKWGGSWTAFHGFDVARVADYGPDDVSRLAEDARIVRNRRKILVLVDEYGSFLGYLWSLDHLDDFSGVTL